MFNSRFTVHRRTLLAGGLAVAALPAFAPAHARAEPVSDPVAQAVLTLFEPSADAASRALFHASRLSPGGQRRWPLAEFEKVMGSVAALSGGFDLVSADRRGGILWLTVRSRRQQAVRALRVRLDRDDAARIYDVSASPMPTLWPGQIPAGPVAAADLPRLIEQRVRFAVDRDEFSGAIRVVSPAGAPVYEAAFGRARRQPDVPNTLATRFHLGSADKSFTALMIVGLVQQGSLGFDTPLAKVLPDYPNQDFARACTIRHLLSHTAGLGMLFNRPGWDNRRAYARMAEILPAFAAAPPMFAPGAGAAYSNEGFVVLGAVLEAITGESWYDLLASRIYQPAGMTRSGHFLYQQLPAEVAFGYRYHQDDHLGLNPRRANDDFLGVRGNSCGGGYATVADMTSYLRALRAGSLVPPAITAQMITPSQPGLGDYGLGFELTPLAPGRTLVGHSGSGAHTGIDGNSGIIWETGWALSVLGNYDSPFTKTVAADIAAMLAKVS